MSMFSSEVLQLIKDSPLDQSVGHLRPAFQEIGETEELGHKILVERRDAISSLVEALQVHPVAKSLYPREHERPLNRQLASIYSDIESDAYDFSGFTSLTELVANGAGDVDVWTAVINLIITLSRRTPPPKSIVPSYLGTPFIPSSAEFQGSEQTRRKLFEPLIDELSSCTYENTAGFFEKYFERKPWSKTSKKIFKTVKGRHVDGRWKDIPQRPTQDAVWEWLDKFQKENLCNGSRSAPGMYHTTESKAEVTGTQSDRQLDIILKHRDVVIGAKHNAKDYRVIGELTASDRGSSWKSKFIQLATYIRDIFSAQPTRRFVHGFLLFGTVMEPFIFDRSGAYSGDSFDIHEEPERFIRVFAGYALMSDKELGMDTFIKKKGLQLFVTMKSEQMGKQMSLELEPHPIAIQRAIVSRGTCCYCAKKPNLVVKCSWASDKRRPEAELLRAAQDVKGIPRLLGFYTGPNIAEMRCGLTFSKKRKLGTIWNDRTSDSSKLSFTSQSTRDLESMHLKGSTKRRTEIEEVQPWKKSRSNSIRSSLHREYRAIESVAASPQTPIPAEEKFRNRSFTCLAISPAGRSLRHFTSTEVLLKAFRDAIRAHRSLVLESKVPILHRDVSENNIIITDPKQNHDYFGMLIDFDLAVRIGEDGKNELTDAGVMTGTLEYIAIEILEGALRKETQGAEHTYRHDLESFLYVFLSVCTRYGWDKGKKPKEHPFSAWFTGKLESIAMTKSGNMEIRQFERYILPKFSPKFECLKGLARDLRNILFLEGQLRTGTPRQATELYDPMIKAFEDTIHTLDW